MGKFFGTDGIRGVANTELTPELAFKIGRAAAFELKGNEGPIVIGKDTRASCDMLQAAITAGITSVGVDVIELGIIPTPGVAYLTRHYKAIAGVVISASHNPGEFNGIKLFSQEGFKLPDSVEESIEEKILNIETVLDRPIGKEIGTVRIADEAKRRYLDFLKSKVVKDLTGLKVAIDCGHGATSQFAPELFRELGAEVVAVNTEPDGMNINKSCGSTNTNIIQDLTVETGSDIGLAYDGDGDRMIAVDECGQVMDGDHILAACGSHLMAQKKLPHNTVVGTVMSNIGLDEFADKTGMAVEKTAVGDRYVIEKMLEGGFALGGEQSGHIIFIEHNTTGDGILSSLMLVDAMLEAKSKLSELNQLMITYPQVLVNARVSSEKKHHYIDDEEILQAIQNLEDKFRGNGRVLIRPSGTEPLVRVMIEGKDQTILEEEAKALAELIERRLQ